MLFFPPLGCVGLCVSSLEKSPSACTATQAWLIGSSPFLWAPREAPGLGPFSLSLVLTSHTFPTLFSGSAAEVFSALRQALLSSQQSTQLVDTDSSRTELVRTRGAGRGPIPIFDIDCSDRLFTLFGEARSQEFPWTPEPAPGCRRIEEVEELCSD